MPEISVIVPVYNVEKYLKYCVDSLLDQTFTNFELILVDDGSPDNCGKICDGYALKDERVKVIHQENGGLSAARNAGLDWIVSHSKSKWVTFVDADDYVSKLYLEKLYDAVCQSGSQISAACFHEVNSHNWTTESKQTNFKKIEISGREACRLIYSRCWFLDDFRSSSFSPVQACNKLYSIDLFSSIRFPVGKIHEDQGTTYKLFYSVASVTVVDLELYNYYINNEGITHNKFSISRFDDLDFLNEAIQFYINHNENVLAEAAIERYNFLHVKYCLEARKAFIYHKIPKRYSMGNLVHQANSIERMYGRNQYEYVMAQYYPSFLKIQSITRKIVRVLRYLMSGKEMREQE